MKMFYSVMIPCRGGVLRKRILALVVVMICQWHSITAIAQTIEITGVPAFGSAGNITGTVTGFDPSTHRVAAYLYIEGAGWWTKPSFGMPTVPINPDGTFNAFIGVSGLDPLASHYSVSVVPNGTTPPQASGASTLDLGVSSLASTYEQRYGTNLSFAGRNWGVKQSPQPVGPGGNRFSASPNDVWVDQDGLHLTINQHGGAWNSTEVVLPENLGYGTYMFQTNSRQDILDANAVFGAFTFDIFGDDSDKPDWPFREIDFEDSRWGNPSLTTNSQAVVQPFFLPGALERITLPDLSTNAELTRFFTWTPGQVEFYTLLGHYLPDNFPQSAIIDHTIISDDIGNGIKVPEPGRENFRFNLWLFDSSAPVNGQSVEVVINDFQFTPLLPGDFNGDGRVDAQDFLEWQLNPGLGSLADWEADFGSPLTGNLASVPEPGAGLLFTLLAVCCCSSRQATLRRWYSS